LRHRTARTSVARRERRFEVAPQVARRARLTVVKAAIARRTVDSSMMP